MKFETEVHTLSQYLSLVIHSRNLSLRDVAPQVDMSVATLSRITRGANFEQKWIVPIAKWCELTPLELWDLLEQKR